MHYSGFDTLYLKWLIGTLNCNLEFEVQSNCWKLDMALICAIPFLHWVTNRYDNFN